MSYMPDPQLITFCVQPRDVGSYATCAATSHKMLAEIKRLNTNILAALGQLHHDPGDDPDPSSLLPVAAAGVYAEVVRLRAELDAARAVIERLPKTADGVPITPGMTLYSSRKEPCGHVMVTEYRDGDTVERMICGKHTIRKFGHSNGWLVHAHEVYSTRKAAESAREKP